MICHSASLKSLGYDFRSIHPIIEDKLIGVGWIRERVDRNEFQLTGHAHKERQEEVIKTEEIRKALL